MSKILSKVPTYIFLILQRYKLEVPVLLAGITVTIILEVNYKVSGITLVSKVVTKIRQPLAYFIKCKSRGGVTNNLVLFLPTF